MTRITRQIILLCTIAISIIAIVMLLLYGSGYRFNWKRGTITPTGGVSVTSIPRHATVTIEPLGLQRTTPALINTLVSGRYTLKVERSGYVAAVFNFALKPHRTLQFRPVILWPREPDVVVVKDYGSFIFDPDVKNIEFNGEPTEIVWNWQKDYALLRQAHSLYLYDSKAKELRVLLRRQTPITEALWYHQQWYILYVSGDQLHALDVRREYGNNDTVLYQAEGLNTVRLTLSGRVIYFRTEDGVYKLRLRDWR